MRCNVATLAQSFVVPSRPTPSDTLGLSVIDRVPSLRHMVRSLHVFKHGQQPAAAIRAALAEALVMYHPFAGRLVDSDRGETVVECTGEGVWFVEATASCSLEEVRYLDHRLVIPQEELLPQASTEFDLLNVPAMMQVTEFTCGGFVVGITFVHNMADGMGAAQFVNAIAELARGLPCPAVDAVWCRDLIPSPPNLPPTAPADIPSFKLRETAFYLPSDYISKIQAAYFQATGHPCSAFDISTAKAWQARVRAIGLDPGSPVHVCFFASTRHLLTPEVLPQEGGFYGNCFYPVTVTATSGAVADAEVVEVVGMVRDAKVRLSGEFGRWARGEMKKDPYALSFTYDSLFVSDWRRVGFFEVDYGWGKPVNVVPFAFYDFMAVAIFGAPPAPKKGVWVMTQCVEEKHLPAFKEHMKAFT